MCKPNTHRADFVSYLGCFSSPLEARVKDCVEDVCTIYLPHNNQINAMHSNTFCSGVSVVFLCGACCFPLVRARCFVIQPFLLSFVSNIFSFFLLLQTVCVCCTYFRHCAVFATFVLLHISCAILSTSLVVLCSFIVLQHMCGVAHSVCAVSLQFYLVL